ncbi:hypothetical protein [Xanthomonas sontii]|uniref:hypothetical protein n=1 Tax=Xanthomonas sontii TaxID=2650745 RepID=UPI00123D7BED|nr:hypothetical protein [Xanthomonas sontii]
MTALMQNTHSYLPATVVAAIIIFLIKELLELRRRKKERTRKLKAVSLLLAEEIEKNHWAHRSFFSALSSLQKSDEGSDKAQFRLHVSRNGTEHLRVKYEPDEEFESGQWIPKFHDEQYKKLLPILAELDENLFKQVNLAYGELAELTHYRDMLVGFLAGEDPGPGLEQTRDFLASLAHEKMDYFKSLNSAYKAINGEDLKGWRLR